LLLLLNAACLAKKQHTPILYSLVWPWSESMPSWSYQRYRKRLSNDFHNFMTLTKYKTNIINLNTFHSENDWYKVLWTIWSSRHFW
jgi:hypothetical protein